MVCGLVVHPPLEKENDMKAETWLRAANWVGKLLVQFIIALLIMGVVLTGGLSKLIMGDVSSPPVTGGMEGKRMPPPQQEIKKIGVPDSDVERSTPPVVRSLPSLNADRNPPLRL